ncbi:TraB/GumN family protein [Thiohalomonas denitrificans]|uniref:TraB/GumN family protein n=1 Tax=Thiohalomonas denitrificans TaxID=415747 RepID=UPI0026E93F2E|nr:TraB/GumN family protein [Thiohalomonas denitrificans]
MPTSLSQEPIRVVRRGNVEFTLLGTAHVSRASAEEVTRQLDGGQYDAVAVELCPSRHAALTTPDVWGQTNLFRLIRDGKAGMLAASLALGAYQQRLADQFGVEPGAEMRAAVERALAHSIPVLLVDRDIGITLKRTYRSTPRSQRFTLLGGLLASVLSREKVSEEEIERLKEGDILETTFAEFTERSATLQGPLIDERDRYMAARLCEEADAENYRRVLVVIGAGHLKGLADYLSRGEGCIDPQATIAELEALPPPARWPRVLPWIIVAVILTGFAIGFSRSPELGGLLVWEWILINGTLSAVGTLIAGAHPLTILAAFIAAPWTSLNPMIGASMVAGAVEVWLRKPRVADFGTLRSDVTSLRGWWRNRVSRTLLVFFLAGLGSSLGTYLAGFRIYDHLLGG